ncbi:MAG: hypothetical protein ACP5TY_12890, partial [Thermodesulforhabdaceae bacterium]
ASEAKQSPRLLRGLTMTFLYSSKLYMKYTRCHPLNQFFSNRLMICKLMPRMAFQHKGRTLSEIVEVLE